jgi:PAS domain S-box-containing protein
MTYGVFSRTTPHKKETEKDIEPVMPLLPATRPVDAKTPKAGRAVATVEPQDLDRAFFDRMTERAYLLDAADRFIAFNRAAEVHYGVPRETVLGRVIWQRFPVLAGTDQQELFARVRACGREETHVLPSLHRPGHTVNVTLFPHRDGLGVVFRDITETLDAQARLEAQRAALQASEAAALASIAEIGAIYDTAPVGLCVIDRAHRFLRVNARLAEINGLPAADHVGRTVEEVLPGIAADVEPLLRRIFETGEPMLDIEFTGETPARPGVTRVWTAHWMPVKSPRGETIAVNAVVEEITGRREAEAHERLLVQEIHHRSRNLLMVVRSLIQLTWNDGPDRFLPVLDERLRSLARVHEHLATSSWRSAQLRAVIGQELSAYASGERIACEGPDVAITAAAAQSIAMVVHELTTNALKHGALSMPGGRIAVGWSFEADRLAIRWAENGGPSVDPPARDGFGSRLIRLLVEAELKGRFAPAWSPTGLVCEIQIPRATLEGAA